jgi:hypothetical protein
VGESSPKDEADVSDIINTCLCQLKVSDAGRLLTVESQYNRKVQCECMFWDCFPFQEQYLFHPFPGRSDPSTSAHSQGQYQERPAVCSLTIGKRCGRLVSEVVVQNLEKDADMRTVDQITRLWALMIWSSTNIA